jgi:NTP pyrophosphatase (non-canonical NTP hydrolase)
MDLWYFQDSVAEWECKQPWCDGPPDDPLIGLVEEVGELAHAHLKQKQKIRGTYKEHQAAKIDAIGDIMIYLADYCARCNINLNLAVIDTWDKVRKRNWSQYPTDGLTK